MGADESKSTNPLKEKSWKPEAVDDDIPTANNSALMDKSTAKAKAAYVAESNKENANTAIAKEKQNSQNENKPRIYSKSSTAKGDTERSSPRKKGRSHKTSPRRRHEEIKGRHSRKYEEKTPPETSSTEKKHTKHRDEKSSRQSNHKKGTDHNTRGNYAHRRSEEQTKSSSKTKSHRKSGKRKKDKTGDLKKKRIHSSAPDLSKPNVLKVNEWLNSSYAWQQHLSSWNNAPYSFSYTTLPSGYGAGFPVEKTRPIVDGMGSPIGTLYPDGLFQPENGFTGSQSRDFRNISPQFPSMRPYATLPYAYPYIVTPQIYMSTGALYNAPDQHGRNTGRKIKTTRSHSEDRLNDPNNTPERTSNSKKKKHRIFVSSEQEEDNTLLTNTKSYKANLEIAVDSVKHAEFLAPIEKNYHSESNKEFGEDSSDDSSSNDIILDEYRPEKGAEKTDISTQLLLLTTKPTVFQPLSEREVYIDDFPDEAVNLKGEEITKPEFPVNETLPKKFISEENINQHTNNHIAPPIMRLCERESIVATSYMTNGGKVFCIKRTQLTETPPPSISNQNSTLGCGFSAASSISDKTAHSPLVRQNRVESGTWFGFTGSPPDIKANNHIPVFEENSKHSTREESLMSFHQRPISVKQKSREELIAYSLSSNMSLPVKDEKLHEPERALNNPPNRYELKCNGVSDQLIHNSLLSVQNNPPVSPSFSLEERSSDHSEHILSYTSQSDTSSDTETSAREDDNVFAGKLIRIDSHDSLTMKRRHRYHYSSSSHSNKVRDFERRATIASISHADLSEITSQSLKTKRQQSAEFISPISRISSNPFKDPGSLDSNVFLHRARSEEHLKRELSRSSDALMAGLSSTQKRESLEERAARILGLGPRELTRAKQKQTTPKQYLIPEASKASSNKYESDQSSATFVTPTSTAKGSISHSSIDSITFLSQSTSSESSKSGVFAVSVTDSMMKKPQEKYVIKSVNSDALRGSSSKSADSTEAEDAYSSDGNNYTVTVDDSLLKDVSMSDKAKLSIKRIALSTPTEDKLQEEFFTTANSVAPNAIMSQTSGQASIVASYAENIYDRTPRSSSSHTRDYSDDTTGSESLEQFELIKDVRDKLHSMNDNNNRIPREETSSKSSTPTKSIENNVSSPPSRDTRVIDSPVPIASHSAPLTSGELDIIMQLYNSENESVSTYSHDVKERRKAKTDFQKNEIMKRKVAQAIGFETRNINLGNRPSNLGKIEDFDIKVFPGSASSPSTSSVSPNETRHDVGKVVDEFKVKEAREKDSAASRPSASVEGGVLEVMQSLGLDPNQTMVMSL